jgi:hypothetical protein
MVVEKAAQSDPCRGCSQADGCQQAYRQLGETEGPSVARTAIVAFLLPLVVFIVTLGGWGWWLGSAVAEPYRGPLALAGALSVTTGLLLVMRRVARRCRRT